MTVSIAMRLVCLLSLSCLVASYGDQPSVNDYIGEWYGAVGTNEIDSYRVTIKLLENPAELQVRELDELNKPWIAPNPIERLKLAGFKVEGGIPISMTWARRGQAKPETVLEAFFLPQQDAEVRSDVSSPLLGAVTGRGLSAPLYYDAKNDRLISSKFLPCFHRTMELAKSLSRKCLL